MKEWFDKPEKKRPLSNTAALLKIQNYCAYQERCHQEVQNKLRDLGLWGDAADALMSQLIQDNFLNEERFATTFARGKFRIKRFGKIRIKLELKQRKVPEYCIKKAMQEIDRESELEGGYQFVLEKTMRTKLKDYAHESPENQRVKLFAFAQRRGFETEFILKALNQIAENPDIDTY
jgi:regulatory protein